MSNDLATTIEPRPGLESNVVQGVTAARVLDGVAQPFVDADEARMVLATCRRLLARHVDHPQLADSMFLVVATKVLDEVHVDAADRRFVAIEGEPRISACRFDAALRDTRRALVATAGSDVDVEVELPELVAHELLRQLGSFSVLATAERPDGSEVVRALFADAIGTTSADGGDAGGIVRAFAEVLRRRAPFAPIRATGFGAIASAAVGAAGSIGEPARPGSATAVVVDLRDGADRDPVDARPARS